MDKNEFTTELKELMATMSEAEIEKTISAINACKTVICKRNNQEREDKSRLLGIVERNESELRFTGKNGKTGTIKAIGASLLTANDFHQYKSNMPEIEDEWWLYEAKQRVKNNVGCWAENLRIVCKIRPVIIVDKIDGDLQLGETFYINDEMFRLISPCLIIKNSCLYDSCTYTSVNYDSSLVKLCVDGWFAKLVKKNNDGQKRNG